MEGGRFKKKEIAKEKIYGKGGNGAGK